MNWLGDTRHHYLTSPCTEIVQDPYLYSDTSKWMFETPYRGGNNVKWTKLLQYAKQNQRITQSQHSRPLDTCNILCNTRQLEDYWLCGSSQNPYSLMREDNHEWWTDRDLRGKGWSQFKVSIPVGLLVMSDWGNPWKTSVRIAGSHAEFRTWYLTATVTY
jgi:hypothetical protein